MIPVAVGLSVLDVVILVIANYAAGYVAEVRFKQKTDTKRQRPRRAA